MNQSERRQYLIRALLDENKEYSDIDIPAAAAGQAQLLRGLMNIRAPHEADLDFIKIQDVYLKQRAEEKGIIRSDDLQPASTDDPALCIWQGDITRLECDAIVNAANSGMTGCYIPNHNCIDNCIRHTAAPRVRRDHEKTRARRTYRTGENNAGLRLAVQIRYTHSRSDHPRSAHT